MGSWSGSGPSHCQNKGPLILLGPATDSELLGRAVDMGWGGGGSQYKLLGHGGLEMAHARTAEQGCL